MPDGLDYRAVLQGIRRKGLPGAHPGSETPAKAWSLLSSPGKSLLTTQDAVSLQTADSPEPLITGPPWPLGEHRLI